MTRQSTCLYYTRFFQAFCSQFRENLFLFTKESHSPLLSDIVLDVVDGYAVRGVTRS